MHFEHMIKSLMRWYLGIVAVAVLPFVVIVIFRRGEHNGIIIVEGYSHAVVICGESLTVNDGHYRDQQIQELIEKAETECPK